MGTIRGDAGKGRCLKCLLRALKRRNRTDRGEATGEEAMLRAYPNWKAWVYRFRKDYIPQRTQVRSDHRIYRNAATEQQRKLLGIATDVPITINSLILLSTETLPYCHWPHRGSLKGLLGLFIYFFTSISTPQSLSPPCSHTSILECISPVHMLAKCALSLSVCTFNSGHVTESPMAVYFYFYWRFLRSMSWGSICSVTEHILIVSHETNLIRPNSLM